LNPEHLAQCQIPDSGTCINQNVVIQHQARGPQISCHATAASKYG
jgi:hypothetical protein